MRKILRFLKSIWLLNMVRRVLYASSYYNKKYIQILRWGFTSREDTNFTFHLTPTNMRYMANMIAVVTGKKIEEIEAYMQEAAQDTALKTFILAQIQATPERKFADKEVRFGKRLGWYAFVRAMKPKVLIETGVDKGLGAVILCAALLRNEAEGFEGQYYGTDINPKAGYMLAGKYKDVGKILYGDSIQSLANFQDKIDLFINDSDHSATYEYQEYLTIKPLLMPHTVILGDNAHCTDSLVRFSNEHGRKFLFFAEEPAHHWYPGAGIGISFTHIPN